MSVQAGQIEQILDEPVQARGLGPDDPSDLGHALRRDDAIGERLGIPGDGRERSAQVVRDGQEELALPGLRVRQRSGQLVERGAHGGHLGRAALRHGDVAGTRGEVASSRCHSAQGRGHATGHRPADEH